MACVGSSVAKLLENRVLQPETGRFAGEGEHAEMYVEEDPEVRFGARGRYIEALTILLRLMGTSGPYRFFFAFFAGRFA